MNSKEKSQSNVWRRNAKFFIDTFAYWERNGVTDHSTTAKALVAEKPKSILEIGSGSGILYKRLLQAGFEGKYLGMDQTPEFVTYCNDLFGGGLFRVGKMTEAYIPGRWDIGIMQDVLRHNTIEDRKLIIKNVVPHITKKLIMAEPLGDDDAVWIELTMTRPWDNEKANLQYYDGSLNLDNLIELIGSLKPIETYKTIKRTAFVSDTKDNYFIIVKFKED